MRFAHFFIDRPVFATVVSLVLLIVGGIAYTQLPVSQYPEIAPPTIVVRASYPGADAETVAATVATPIEQEVNGVEGMLYMSSYSSSDGAMALTVTFRLGTDLDQAQVLVQNRVSVAEARLPEEVRRLGITTAKSSPDLMMVVHMLSPDDTYDQLYVSNYARSRVRDVLLRLDGVGDLQIFGEREYSLRVWLDPEKLSAYGMTASDVVQSLREQNVQVSGGSIGAPPAASGNAFQYTVTTQGRFEDARDFRYVIVKSTDDGRLISLEDVARIELGAKDYITNSYLNGKQAVALGIFQRPGTNALETADEIKAAMDELAKDFPKGLAYEIIYNPTEFVAQSIDEVYTTILEAMVLVVIVIIVFLQSWRMAIVPIVAIPVSLIGTLAVLFAFGFSLNMLTLFGLVLAIGIVVDDAIVVVENVERNVASGLHPYPATHLTMDEVGTAVVAISLVLIAVFVPTAFVPGITGQFYLQFAVTIAVSTAISAFVSLTLSPALAALLFKPHHVTQQRPRFFLTRWGRALGNGFNRGFDRVAHGYARAIGFLVGSWATLLVMLAVFGGLIYATIFMVQSVPRGFIPVLDQGYAIVVVQLPDGASLSRTDAVVQRVAGIVEKTPGIDYSIAFTGLSGATFTNASNQAVVFARFKSFEERLAAGQSAGQIVGTLFGSMQSIQEAFIIALPPPPIRGVGNAGGFKMQLQERNSSDMRPILGVAYQMMARANQTPGLMGVFTTFSASSPQFFLAIDRDKARMLNVPIPNIFDTLSINLGTAYVNDFNAFGRVYQVRAQADQSFRLERDDIAKLKVRSATGALVPLGTLVEIRDVTGPSLVQRYNMYVSVPLQGNAAPGVSTGQALDAMEKVAQESLPPGTSFEWTELAYQERSTGNTAVFIFGLSVLFVFLALAAQYESWIMPFAIVLIVPLGVLAAMLGVSFRGLDNNILVQVGLIVLIGLAAKNAILIVEFARQAQERGLGPVEAAVEACRLRLRPILMTAFAFILGVVPLVIATGPGAEMRQSLGTAVFSGMLGVTIVGLFLTPVFFVTLRRLFPHRPARQEGEGHPAEPASREPPAVPGAVAAGEQGAQ
jgi:HAE1 family hydrophobic/amphiphilic exporter-1